MAYVTGTPMSRVRPRVRGRADLHLRVVLRTARGHLRLRRDPVVDQPGEDRGRAAEHLAVRRSAARRSGQRRRPRRRVHAPRARRAPRRRARPRRGLDQERHAQPDQLVQGPRHVGRAVEGGGVRLQDRGVREHRQPRQLRRGARGARRAPQLRVHPRRPRAGQDRHDGGVRRQRRRDRRQLRRREPVVRRARRHVPVGVRERQRAAVLRGGLEDARVRDGRAARLGGARPRGRSDREWFVAHEDPQGLRRAVQGRPARRRAGSSESPVRRRRVARPSRRRGSRAPTRSSR